MVGGEMVKIEYLHTSKGADRYGDCMGCGKNSAEDIWMSRIKISYDNGGNRRGIQFCLCGKCRSEMLRNLEW